MTDPVNNVSAINPHAQKTNERQDEASIQAWLKTQRGRPQYRPTPSAGRAVAKIIRPLAAKFGTGVTAIEQNWPEIAGRRFAKISRPLKISGGTSNRILTIEAAGAAGALIQASSGPILDRLNTFLGYGQVARIKIIQRKTREDAAAPKAAKRGLTPGQEGELHSGLENIKNIELKKALEGLGRNAMAQGSTPKAPRARKDTD